MGHILFGLPEIGQFHLYSRLARTLMAREHRVTVLAGDPVAFEFYCHQGLACQDLRPTWRPPASAAPIEQFAARDCHQRGLQNPRAGRIQRAMAPLERRLEPLARALQGDPPDLVLMTNGRTGLHRLLHFSATEQGVKTLHLGDGLLPMTTQLDTHGVDGDSSLCAAQSSDFRRTAANEELLAAACSSWLGQAYPPPLPRLGVTTPPLLGRAIATSVALIRRQWQAAFNGLTDWEASQELRLPPLDPGCELPDAPFLALLLQSRSDPRLRLDFADDVHTRALILRTRSAVRRIDPKAHTVVVEPSDITWWARRRRWPEDVRFLHASAAPTAIAAAMAVVSINPPRGLAGLLANTPVLHLGRTPYGLRGVSFHTSLDRLDEDLERALTLPTSNLRKRFLTRILKDNHVWCPPSLPDGNGVAGIVQRIELRMGNRNSGPIRYQPGPAWPLTR